MKVNLKMHDGRELQLKNATMFVDQYKNQCIKNVIADTTYYYYLVPLRKPGAICGTTEFYKLEIIN